MTHAADASRGDDASGFDAGAVTDSSQAWIEPEQVVAPTPMPTAAPPEAGYPAPDPGVVAAAQPGVVEQLPPVDAGYLSHLQPAPAGPIYDPLAESTWGPGETGKTNVLAIVAMITSIAGILFVPFIGPIAGIVLGHISLRQIAQRGERGRPLALFGTILGYVGIVLHVVLTVFVMWMFAQFYLQLSQ